jgi:DNA-dependent protein kinase catalytic subunit
MIDATVYQESPNQTPSFVLFLTGDLPDVSSLTVKGFIEPLIALAWRDDNLARLLLSKIVQAIAADHKNDMRSLVQDLLTTTSGTSTPFIYWLLRVSFDDPDTILPPSLIGPACLRSTNYHMGIMVLEKQILQIQNPTTRSGLAKKRKAPGEAPSDMANELTEAWAQLSKLYKALGEEDVLLGLYEKYIMKQDITKHALEAELSGDYAEAYRLYEDAAVRKYHLHW